MEQVTKRDGVYYYGRGRCGTADDVYQWLREDYHRDLGRRAYHRLNRLGQRKERVHGFGFEFEQRPEGWEKYRSFRPVPYRILGLVHISYCRIIGCWDFPVLPDDEYDIWTDWLFSHGSRGLRRVGTTQKTGRTSKRLRKRYR